MAPLVVSDQVLIYAENKQQILLPAVSEEIKSPSSILLNVWHVRT